MARSRALRTIDLVLDGWIQLDSGRGALPYKARAARRVGTWVKFASRSATTSWQRSRCAEDRGSGRCASDERGWTGKELAQRINSYVAPPKGKEPSQKGYVGFRCGGQPSPSSNRTMTPSSIWSVAQDPRFKDPASP